MSSIRYPVLKEGAMIGVTAPSSGAEERIHPWLEEARERLAISGFGVQFGETVWTQNKAKSAPAAKRAEEFNAMVQAADVDLIIPPWGGELLIEMVDQVDYDRLPCKWVMGYSDLSVLLLAITLKTGIATAHGTNFVDLRGEVTDETTAMWQAVLSTETGGAIVQHSSSSYLKEWPKEAGKAVFNLTEPTMWSAILPDGLEPRGSIRLQGRLLGGCIDVIRHLIGTPYGDVAAFREVHIPGEKLLWYLENCELVTTDVRRSLVQMKLAGWFERCSGIMFGRSPANRPVENYMIEDVYADLADELGLPIIYDIDCGHVPPQLTLINGAFAEVEVEAGRGTVKQYFT
ncbi:muramoyltetrapeptide carboxypeptidase LdcA involved in peptidoglycan recycling [Paenibacillus taihuensis]|uniref:Muramoyltetrapeptide carboxypeptidase LdcA involved in peptidoglycan recycling n=1 Tax=Paenibacillus taihuensis TaxID=1156355 RepID=A0A3D9S1D0_9BACL|nr:S66 peptidase family protein [Paenibacillus taihuensis]REE86417.1 muramoyltetrapeptide carboxypeptidase LdcA involved in peptidoglycan recycling [Paenibacillus taihuensis]